MDGNAKTVASEARKALNLKHISQKLVEKYAIYFRLIE